MSRVIYKFSSTLQSLVKYWKPRFYHAPHKRPELIDVLEKYTPKLKNTKVIWEYLSPSWIKVNTDGACKGNPGRSSIGFVFKNEEGDVKYACGTEIQEGTNTKAEARAVVEAWRYCLEHDYFLIDFHTDSMVLKNVVNGVWTIPWSMVESVEEIKELSARCNVTISHTLREGNRLVDYLANYALDVGSIECHSFGGFDIKEG